MFWFEYSLHQISDNDGFRWIIFAVDFVSAACIPDLKARGIRRREDILKKTIPFPRPTDMGLVALRLSACILRKSSLDCLLALYTGRDLFIPYAFVEIG